MYPFVYFDFVRGALLHAYLGEDIQRTSKTLRDGEKIYFALNITVLILLRRFMRGFCDSVRLFQSSIINYKSQRSDPGLRPVEGLQFPLGRYPASNIYV